MSDPIDRLPCSDVVCARGGHYACHDLPPPACICYRDVDGRVHGVPSCDVHGNASTLTVLSVEVSEG